MDLTPEIKELTARILKFETTEKQTKDHIIKNGVNGDSKTVKKSPVLILKKDKNVPDILKRDMLEMYLNKLIMEKDGFVVDLSSHIPLTRMKFKEYFNIDVLSV